MPALMLVPKYKFLIESWVALNKNQSEPVYYLALKKYHYTNTIIVFFISLHSYLYL